MANKIEEQIIYIYYFEFFSPIANNIILARGYCALGGTGRSTLHSLRLYRQGDRQPGRD